MWDFATFKREVDDLKTKDVDYILQQREDLEIEMFHIKIGDLPPSATPRVIRRHTMTFLAMNDAQHAIDAMEETAKADNRPESYTILWLAYMYVGNKDKASSLTDKIIHPVT